MSSSTLVPASHDPDGSVRPRNRRLISVEDGPGATGSSIRGTARLPEPTSPLRERSPIPSSRLNVGPEDGRSSSRRRSPAGLGSGLLDTSSWAPSWASMQEFASGFLSAGQPPPYNRHGRNDSRNESRTRDPGHRAQGSRSSSRPTINDVGAGILADRDAALQAAKTASVLESWDGVNGGLDVTGKYKRRTSEELSRTTPDEPPTEDTLVYIHHVKPTDTYAGIVLRYGCREDAFKKVNGLWSRDGVQMRKWLAIPVDACDIKGRICAGPSDYSKSVDLLAPTPAEGNDSNWGDSTSKSQQEREERDDFFTSRSKEPPPEPAKSEDSHQEWTHVRWVSLDHFPEPVEIGRISRKAHGYFPPRRKRSLHTISNFTTPRQSLDMLSGTPLSNEGPDRGGPSSRRHSLLSNRPTLPGAPGIPGIPGTSTPMSSRSRGGSVGADTRPLWMRRPGGVGSLSKNVRTPGPEKDILNTWAKKHFPALNIDSLPSMSVMGTESASFGFSHDATGIAESPYEEVRDLNSAGRQGSGLDRAAATVETWLRGAFAKRPGTPIIGPRRDQEGDLIELLDTQSDDGRLGPAGSGGVDTGSGLLSQSLMGVGSSSRSDGDGSVRGRTARTSSSMSLNKKKDD